MSDTVLVDDAPSVGATLTDSKKKKEIAKAKGLKAGDHEFEPDVTNSPSLRKYAVLYFGDLVSANLIMKYLEGKVLGNINHLEKPKQQIVIVNFNTKDKKGDDKASKLLDTIMNKFGNVSDVIDIDTKFENKSAAYFNSLVEADTFRKVLDKLRDEKVDYLVIPYHSAWFGLMGNVVTQQQIQQFVSQYDTDNNCMIKTLYENIGRSLESEVRYLNEHLVNNLKGKDDPFLDGIRDHLQEIDPSVLEQDEDDDRNYVKRMIDYKSNIGTMVTRSFNKETKEQVLLDFRQYKLD